jgi:hypothetical protein
VGFIKRSGIVYLPGETRPRGLHEVAAPRSTGEPASELDSDLKVSWQLVVGFLCPVDDPCIRCLPDGKATLPVQ